MTSSNAVQPFRYSPEQQPAWQTLSRLATEAGRQSVADLLEDDARSRALRLDAPGMHLDFSKQPLTLAGLEALTELARQQGLGAGIEALFDGAHLNTTEDRPALHTALRAAAGSRPEVADAVVTQTLERLRRYAAGVLDGSVRGATGRAFTDVVHIGIGGSHLGPELAVEALRPAPGALRCHFVANIDGEALRRALHGLDPETTLFVVVSKSFSTLETRINAESARSWFIEHMGGSRALEQHFVAVSANVEAAAAFGIEPSGVFPMWDWVGGRFSLWSAVGLPIALSAGPEAFMALLDGARAMDEHFRSAPLERNAPVLMALAGIWNGNFLGAGSLAVLPYSQRLRLLPDYLQQLEMESNGKSVHQDGSPVGVHTMGVLWGGEGTTGQHAFYQLLHQGTRSFAADFIVLGEPGHPLEDHHRWLQANALAQSQAMMAGQAADDPHRRVTGDKATTTIVMQQLSPYALGALLALYEHKVFCQGVVWNINSFDQWGVEVGKRLAVPIHEQLGDGAAVVGQDSSTRHLIDHLRGDSLRGEKGDAS